MNKLWKQNGFENGKKKSYANERRENEGANFENERAVRKQTCLKEREANARYGMKKIPRL